MPREGVKPYNQNTVIVVFGNLFGGRTKKTEKMLDEKLPDKFKIRVDPTTNEGVVNRP